MIHKASIHRYGIDRLCTVDIASWNVVGKSDDSIC